MKIRATNSSGLILNYFMKILMLVALALGMGTSAMASSIFLSGDS